ncbi:hypothetical protein EXIGLDRAFT_835360 [Exidia glandulosa HHB12029]|uniref:Uncharacterized protein n=1 Tax=Exidia glandulosa HHB12029 TaxID=1314781 RepID=A0A165IVU8_EXIGL|nr:hypothetical protein EXIGLDRAFT_835360 [Exidia glandulosa HHB12029]
MHLVTSIVLLAAYRATVYAQTTRVSATDSRVTYSGTSWQNASICEYNDDGTFTGGQAGCFNLGPSPCTDSFMVARTPGATAELVFRGTGISLNTLTQPGGTLEGLLTITLDADDKTLQSVPVQGKLTCLPPIFKQDGLAPNQDHKLTVVLRQPPATDIGRNESMFLGIVNFIITGDDAQGSSSSTSSSVSPSSTSTGTSSSAATTSSPTSSASAGGATGSPDSAAPILRVETSLLVLVVLCLASVLS